MSKQFTRWLSSTVKESTWKPLLSFTRDQKEWSEYAGASRMSAPWNSWGNYHDFLALTLFGISKKKKKKKKKKDRIRWNSGAIIITDERSTKRSARPFGRNCERRSLTSPRTNNTPSLKKAATNAMARGTKLKWNRRQQLIQRAHRIFSRMWPDDYLQNTVTWSKRSRLSREVISMKTHFPTKGKSISTGSNS